ncbi:hypothetical protein AYI87_20940 [Shewanella sp. KCT]|nr:hypothetical protein AYI87_20940 [Shewanella sp. KCT]
MHQEQEEIQRGGQDISQFCGTQTLMRMAALVILDSLTIKGIPILISINLLAYLMVKGII